MAADATIGPVLVLGGGLAAVSFVCGLRAGGFGGGICVVEAEGEAPYDRPPLSKEFQRHGDAEKIRLDLSRAPGVDWVRGDGAAALDTVQRKVRLLSGRTLDFGTLVLATGARPRTIAALTPAPVPVFTLRTIDDARRIRSLLSAGVRLLVVGGGVIGLELAASARGLGCDVMVAEALDRLMNRCCPTTLADVVARTHRDNGVDLRLNTQVSGFSGNQASLSDGTTFAADLVVVGIGVVPNDELAREAGIACDDGVFVDGHGRTTCAGVRAIGDVTRQRNPISGRFERIETWSNAQNQGAALARTLLDPSAAPYADVPWYWSDQYDLRIQVAGLPIGDEEIVRGEVGPGRKFSLIQLRQGRAVGVACVSNPRDFSALRRLLSSDHLPDRAALSDPSADLRKLVPHPA